MSQSQLRTARHLLGLIVLSAPLVGAIACSSTNTGSPPIPNTGTGNVTKTDSGAGGSLTGDDSGTGDDDGTNPVNTGDDDSGTGTGLIDAGPPSAAAMAAALPQVANSGGTVLKTPKLYSVTYSSYDSAYTTAVTAFQKAIGASQFWSDTTSEYGVGAATFGGAFTTTDLGETACGNGQTGNCITDAQIQAWLKAHLAASSTPALGVGDENGIYTIFFPETVSVTQGPGQYSCQQFGGYHGELDYTSASKGAIKIAYAVIPTCAAQMGDMLTPLNNVTIGLGHELVEAATDPFPYTTPAYQFPPDLQAGWAFAIGGGELSDMCEADPESNVMDPTLGQFIQRSWSNKAAMAGQDPCLPHVQEAEYINTIPVLTDTVTIMTEHLDMTPWNPKLAVAEIDGLTPKTIEVKLINGGTGTTPFKVKAFDYAGLVDTQTSQDGTAYTYMTFTWDNGQTSITGAPGQVLHLTITPTQQAYDLADAGSSDSRMGVSDFGQLPIWIASEGIGADGGVDEEHLSFMLTNFVAK